MSEQKVIYQLLDKQKLQAALQGYSYQKVFRKGFLEICCIFLENLFRRLWRATSENSFFVHINSEQKPFNS